MRVVRDEEGDQGKRFFFRHFYGRALPAKGRHLSFFPRVEDRRRILEFVKYFRDNDGVIRRCAAGSASTAPRADGKNRVGVPIRDVKDALRRNRSLYVES